MSDKPNPGCGFVLCSCDDPERTAEFFSEVSNIWLPDLAPECRCGPCMGMTYRKPTQPAEQPEVLTYNPSDAEQIGKAVELPEVIAERAWLDHVSKYGTADYGHDRLMFLAGRKSVTA